MPAPNPIAVLVREWVAKAENDLKTAAVALTLGNECPTDTVCFHAQQCVEKYMSRRVRRELRKQLPQSALRRKKK